LNANGVINSINSDNDQLQRTLNHEASKVVRYGNTSVADALKMITINPAIELGIDDRVGSIEEGKDGDVVVWSGHPLSIYSKAELTYIDGTKYFDLENDPDDMRIKINAGTDFEDGANFRQIISRRDENACLKDAFILLDQHIQN
jgi:hypothetical protein